MHDGRLYSLYNAVDHYRKNMVVSNTLDSALRKNVELSEEDKNDPVYFLHSLTDTTFLKDKRFSQPSF
jgi:cytochrome c peroxidase